MRTRDESLLINLWKARFVQSLVLVADSFHLTPLNGNEIFEAVQEKMEKLGEVSRSSEIIWPSFLVSFHIYEKIQL